MIHSSSLPKYSKVIYTCNAETKYYIQKESERQETPVKRLPIEMRLAPAGAANVKVNAAKVLLSKDCKNGKYAFITGIQSTWYQDWFVGNDYEFYRGKKVLSLLLFRFANDSNEMEVYYFHQFDKPNSYFRLQFANGAIPHLLNKVAA